MTLIVQGVKKEWTVLSIANTFLVTPYQLFPLKIQKILAAFGDYLLPYLKWAEKGNFFIGNYFLISFLKVVVNLSKNAT